ncbi:unnamed protein product [Heterobilharzia americana]|nr:unnamed protein product [Heterobilharzia americana]CAH8560177.1 unnamed protein product [Heterobilharzia americana]
MDNPSVAVQKKKPVGLERLKLMIKANPLIIVGFVFTGGVLGRSFFAEGAKLKRLLVLRTVGQAFTVTMILISVYKIEPDYFKMTFSRSER